MIFFIVDNGSSFKYEIVYKILQAGHKCEVKKYSPYRKLDPKDADIIILTGGHTNEVRDELQENEPWYRYEFDLIRNSDKPILGICLGHQMIATALGGSLIELEHTVEGPHKVNITKQGKNIIGYNNFVALESHRFVVDDYSNTGLIELGYSESGNEILYHPERNILSVQFHPEVFVNEDSNQLFWDLISVIAAPQRPKIK